MHVGKSVTFVTGCDDCHLNTEPNESAIHHLICCSPSLCMTACQFHGNELNSDQYCTIMMAISVF